MSLSSALLAIALLSTSAAAVAANEIACPKQIGGNGQAAFLDSADVYEGPPANKASLMPDLETWTWELKIEQQTARHTGIPLYLVCRYKGTKAVVQLKIPYPATFCMVEGRKDGTYAGCRSGNRRK